MLSGNRTYIVAALIALVNFARILEWITVEMADTLTSLLLGGGIAFLRAGVKTDTGK